MTDPPFALHGEPLESPCPACDGTGREPTNFMPACRPCQGSGWRPTPHGQALLRFLSRHLTADPFLGPAVRHPLVPATDPL
jgi:hypothetical protein